MSEEEKIPEKQLPKNYVFASLKLQSPDLKPQKPPVHSDDKKESNTSK